MDKTGLQLLGGTQTLVVHKNHIKSCNNPCDHLPATSPFVSPNAPSAPTGTDHYTEHTTQSTGIAGFISSTNKASGSHLLLPQGQYIPIAPYQI